MIIEEGQTETPTVTPTNTPQEPTWIWSTPTLMPTVMPTGFNPLTLEAVIDTEELVYQATDQVVIQYNLNRAIFDPVTTGMVLTMVMVMIYTIYNRIQNL